MIKKSLLKIVCLLIIIGLNWTGLLAVGETFAFFSDSKDSNANTFTAATLYLSLRSGQGNFVPPEIANDMDPGESVARDIYIKKEDSLAFQYNAHSEPVSGSCDLNFYNILELKVWYNWYEAEPGLSPEHLQYRHMDLKYDGLLKDFNLRNLNQTDPDLRIPNSHTYYSNVFYGPDEHWLYFQITLPSTWTENNKFCNFKFVFDGWQDNIENYGDGGFTDKEEIYSTLIDSVFIEEEELVTEDEELDSEEVIENAAEEIPVIEEEPTEEEENPPVEEEPSITEEEEPPPTEEEPPTEENQEQGGIIEEINEIIDEVIDEIVEEIMPDEEIGDEVVSEAEAPIIDEALIIEEASADEIPAVDEQPATVPDDSSSTQDGVGENSSDGGSGDGGDGDTSGSLDSSGPAEGASEGSSETGDSVSE
ncbi:MAG: TasA family protein [Candidatus Nealsonbacteria bacterium]